METEERKDIAEMVKTAKYLAEKDPKAFFLVKNSVDVLKARCDLEKKEQTNTEDQPE